MKNAIPDINDVEDVSSSKDSDNSVILSFNPPEHRLHWIGGVRMKKRLRIQFCCDRRRVTFMTFIVEGNSS